MLEATEFLALIVWIGLLPLCWGYVNWIYPGPLNNNLTFNYIDSVYFTWASSVEEPWMNLWCAPSPSDAQSRNYRKSHGPSLPNLPAHQSTRELKGRGKR